MHCVMRLSMCAHTDSWMHHLQLRAAEGRILRLEQQLAEARARGEQASKGEREARHLRYPGHPRALARLHRQGVVLFSLTLRSVRRQADASPQRTGSLPAQAGRSAPEGREPFVWVGTVLRCAFFL